MSVFLKIKDAFNKASKRGVECDSVYLTDEDYIDFCLDFKKENISEITINNINLSIRKIENSDNSFLTNNQSALKKEESVEKKNKAVDRFYLKIK